MKMACCAVAVCLCLFGVNEAKAQQFLLHVECLLPPPPLVLVETWHQVKISNVTYCVNGTQYAVDEFGGHWCCDEFVCKKVRHRFVEPFDQFGCRIPKIVPGLPAGAESTFQYGLKTHVIAGGKTYFGSWVQMPCGKICAVWLEIQERQAPEPTLAPPTTVIPTPAETAPEIVIPKRQNENGPTLAPSLPGLEVPPPPSTEGASEKKVTPDQKQPRRIDGPVASRRV